MASSSSIGRRWFALLSALLAVFALLQTLLYLFGYDFSLHLYETGISVPLVRGVYLLIAFLLCLPLFLLKKAEPSLFEERSSLGESSAVNYFALLSVAAIAATLFVQMLRLNADDSLSLLILQPTSQTANARSMLILSLVLALPATLYFIGRFMGKNLPYCLIFTLLWLCAYLLRIYFDLSILLMSPIRLMTLVALTALIFFLLCELRLCRGLFSPIVYGISATIASLFAGISGLSGLFLTLLGKLNFSTDTIYMLVQITLALYALFRLRTLLVPAAAPADGESAPAPESNESENAPCAAPDRETITSTPDLPADEVDSTTDSDTPESPDGDAPENPDDTPEKEQP